MNKQLLFTRHSLGRMALRGATEDEVSNVIHKSKWEQAKRGKITAKQRFDFKGISPVNGKKYRYKTVEPVFKEEKEHILVITVKVYYNGEYEDSV